MVKSFLDQIRAAAAAKQVLVFEASPSVCPPVPDSKRTPDLSDNSASDPVDSWQPYRSHRARCRALDHVPMIGRCSKCGDIFPCPSGSCGHVDCADAGNGTALPEFLNVVSIGENLVDCPDGGETGEVPSSKD